MLISFLIGVIGGVLLSVYLNRHLHKKEPGHTTMTTKEDIEKISRDIEEIKVLFEKNDLVTAEKEFYAENKIVEE